MKTIKLGERSGYEIKNTNVIGFFITLFGTGSGVNVDPVIFPSYARILVKLRQSGFFDAVLDGTVPSLWKGSAKKRDYAFDHSCMSKRIVVAKTAGLAGVIEYSYKIMFPTTIQMNGEDTLSVEIDFPNGTFFDHDPALCYMGIREIYGTGVQYFIPRIKDIVFPALETVFDKYIGDNVLKAVVTSGNPDGPLTYGLLHAEIKSDRRNDILDLADLHNEEAGNLSKSIIVLDHELDQVNLKFKMDGITNLAQYLTLVVTNYYIDSNLVAVGEKRERKHEAKMRGKVK